jgi:hypothetical protein
MWLATTVSDVSSILFAARSGSTGKRLPVHRQAGNTPRVFFVASGSRHPVRPLSVRKRSLRACRNKIGDLLPVCAFRTRMFAPQRIALFGSPKHRQIEFCGIAEQRCQPVEKYRWYPPLR